MTAKQFKSAFEIADNPAIDLSDVDTNRIVGYGMADFKPVYVDLYVVAKEIRWHALRFDGTWDFDALDEVRRYGRKSFRIIGEGA